MATPPVDEVLMPVFVAATAADRWTLPVDNTYDGTLVYVVATSITYMALGGSWVVVGGSTVTPAALTKTDDTNVTLTLGGTPTTALLQATSITVGWMGTLAISRGGTGQSTAYAAFDALTVQGADIASAGTTNLATATGQQVTVTGTTTITAFGTAAAGVIRSVRFSGILILTHNATSLILPGGSDITTAAGDTMIVESLGSGNWRCWTYQRAASPPVSGTNTGDQVIPTETNGESVLGSTFSLTNTSGVYEDVGLSLSLPVAGTYLITGGVYGAVQCSTGFVFVETKLYNSTDADVANSETMVVLTTTTGQQFHMTAPINKLITVAGAKTIKLYALRNFSGTVTISDIVSDANGRTRLQYTRLNT